MIKLVISIFGIVFVGCLFVVILAKTSTNTAVSSQQTQQLQAVINGVAFSH
jgi:hypothetical protein